MRNVFINIVCILMFSFAVNESYAQGLFMDEGPYIQNARVGLVDEFLKRFNGDTSHPDVSPLDSLARISNILYLINPPQNIENKDSLYNEAVEFAGTVIKDSVRLNFSDSIWIARAKCIGTIEKAQVSFNVYLNVEHRKDDMYKWAISRVEGDCFDVTPSNANSTIMLYPDDHETKFISLGRMTNEQPFNVARFMSRGSEYDATSVFMYLVKSNKLKIDYVDELEFIFTQVPGYLFSIKYYERESSKSGWLINEFSKVSTKDKTDFLRLMNIECDKGAIDTDAAEKDDYVENDASSEVSDSCSIESPEKVFLSRIVERKFLLKDYMAILDSVDNKIDAGYYSKKLLGLFSPNSYVYIYNATKEKTDRMLIADFLKKVAAHKFYDIYIEKLTIPSWDEAQMDPNSSINEIQLKGIIEPFKEEGHTESEDSDQLVVSRKEQTEDGVEWMPYFGNVYVIIK